MAEQQLLPPGTLVVCRYRMPSILQPWIHEIPVGIVQEPGEDPATWNEHNSEREYCERTGRTPVLYYKVIQHERTENLIPISERQAALSFREKITEFLGEEALANYDHPLASKKERTLI